MPEVRSQFQRQVRRKRGSGCESGTGKAREEAQRYTKVNKAQAVRDYLTANPAAGPTAVVAALKKQGIDVAPNYVAAIKGKLNKPSTAKKLPVAAAAVPAVVVPAAVEKPATNGGTITLEQVKKVARHRQGDGRLPAYDRGPGRHQGRQAA